MDTTFESLHYAVQKHFFDRPLRLDPIRDIIETTAIVRAAHKNGALQIGGGSPKNFYLQTQPTLHQVLLNPTKLGHDYLIQLTTDAPHWGGLSGATPSEARSWGKIKDATKNNVVVYSCASLTFPMLAGYVLARCRARQPKRLYRVLPGLVEQLRDSAVANKELRRQLGELYPLDEEG